MKVLVTGGAGFIGSHTTHQLVDSGNEVIVLDNLSTGHQWTIPAGAKLVHGDCGDRELIARLHHKHKFDAVVHFAAFIRVDESIHDPLKYYWNNTVSSQLLIQACVELGIEKFVFSSSAAVYGNSPTPLVTEQSPTRPISPYGKSKLITEWLLADVSAAHRLRFVALRYFNVAGAGGKGKLGQVGKASHLIKVACESATGARSGMAIFGTDYPTKDGTGVRDYIHVEDLARAHLDALTYLGNGGRSEILNCGYGKGYSVREVIEVVKKVSGVDFKVSIEPRREGDPAALIADASRIEKILGWKPKFNDLELICRSTLEWEKKTATRSSKKAA